MKLHNINTSLILLEFQRPPEITSGLTTITRRDISEFNEDIIDTGLPILRRLAYTSSSEYTTNDIHFAMKAFYYIKNLLANSKDRLAEELKVSNIANSFKSKSKNVSERFNNNIYNMFGNSYLFIDGDFMNLANVISEKFDTTNIQEFHEDEVISGLPILRRLAENSDEEFTSTDIEYAAKAFSELSNLLIHALPKLKEEIRITELVHRFGFAPGRRTPKRRNIKVSGTS